MTKIDLLQELWFSKKRLSLTFPKPWNVELCSMVSDKWKELFASEMVRAIDRPVAGEPLSKIAKGKKEAVILFDDMTRPTRPKLILPYILKVLEDAGIGKRHIRFIVSSGSHGAHRLDDFIKKLGKDVVGKYPVYNHNCFENCSYVGKTSTGVPLYINREFLSCDLKIGIGSVFPHVYCGFSGGGKIVIPGVSGIKTIEKFHSLIPRGSGFSEYKANACTKTMADAARLTGFQFKVDFIVNSLGKHIACFAGDPVRAHEKAVLFGKAAYKTRHGKNYDVIIANAYLKSNEADLAIYNTLRLMNPKGGIFVLVGHNPCGQVNHYLLRSFGKFIGGRRYKVGTIMNPKIKYVVFSQVKECAAFDTFDRPEDIIWKSRWSDIIRLIKKEYARPKVAVFPDATTQLI